MRVLGISAFDRSSAAALVVDGEAVAAMAEERFTRRLGESRFPIRAARFCTDRAGLSASDLDLVVFHQKPLRRFERTLVSHLRAFPRSARCFSKDMFLWLGDRLWVRGRIAGELGVDPGRVAFCSHHASHAAAAFWPSGFEEAAVLVVDGAGEWATTSLWRGTGAGLEPLGEIRFPHSLGLLRAAITQYLGFEPHRDEEKVEALAALGRPRFEAELSELVRLGAGGVVSVDARAFRFDFDGDLLFGKGLVDLLGPVRIPGGPLDLEGDPRFADVAASAQRVVERALLHLATHAHGRVSSDNLCVGGTLALDAHAMARVRRDGPFGALFVEPLAHDGGAALGAALFAARAAGDPRRPVGVDLGDEVRLVVDEDARLRRFDREGEMERHVAEAVASGRLAGLVYGRIAWSDHALGRRSLLADPRADRSREEASRRVVRRDAFLPLRALVTREAAPALFDLPRGVDEPLRRGQLAAPLRPEAAALLPAVRHADGTAWLQVVDESDPVLHGLLGAFEERTGVGALAEADLAVRGEPPVRGALEAVALLERTDLDLLVLEDHLLERTEADSVAV